MAFRFRLRSVLRVRRRDLERATVALAETERSMAAATGRRVAWSDRSKAGFAELKARLGRGLSAPQLRSAVAGVETLSAWEKEAAHEVRRTREKVDCARHEVMRTRARVRALELLRERQASQHRREQQRREQRDLDEVAGRVVAARDSS